MIKRLFLLLSLFLLSSCIPENRSDDSMLARMNRRAEKLKHQILTSNASVPVSGTIYYASSSEGSDENDGLSPERPVQSLERVSGLPLVEGDAVLFRRGDLFRGCVKTHEGCTYSAYGKGRKPRLYGSPCNAAREGEWKETDQEHVWAYSLLLHKDVGTLVFNEGEKGCAMKVMKVRREDGSTTHIDTGEPFADYHDLHRDLDFWHDYQASGTLYLCSTEGNPAERFESIELLIKTHIIYAQSGVTIHNLCLKYCGGHGIGAGTVSSLDVSCCEMGWIGGSIQGENLFGRNCPTRYGNAIEIYGGCGRFTVNRCYIYQVYDAGITHQYSSGGTDDIVMEHVTYSNNLVEDCVYAIEYFLGRPGESSTSRYMRNVHIHDNILLRAGGGWGSQRPDKETPALLKSWGHYNRAYDFVVERNVLSQSTHNLLNVAADSAEWLPRFKGNTYVQTFEGKGGELGVGNRPYAYDHQFPAVMKELFGETEGTFVMLSAEAPME
jgi:hypothetical protein